MAIIQLAGSGQVQSLGRVSPGQKAAAAATPAKMASSILQSVSKAADYAQLLTDQKDSMQAGNRAIEASAAYATLTEQEFVRADQLPASIAASLPPSGLQDDEGRTIYAQDAIGGALGEHYSQAVQSQEQAITNNRSRALYNKFVGDTVSKNLEKGQANAVMAQVKAGRREYEIRGTTLLDSGDLSGYLENGQMANQSGYMDARALDKYNDIGYKEIRVLAEDQLAVKQEDYRVAISQGNTLNAEIAQQEIQGLLDNAAEYGNKVLTKNEREEWIRKTDSLGDTQAIKTALLDTFSTQGYAVTQQSLTEMMLNPEKYKPDQATMAEWNTALGQMQSLVSNIKNSEKAGASELLNSQKETRQSAALQLLNNANTPIIGNKDAEAAADRNFTTVWTQLEAEGASTAVKMNYVYREVAKNKYIPKPFKEYVNRVMVGDDIERLLEVAQIQNMLQTQDKTALSVADLTTPENSAKLNQISMAARNFQGEELEERLAVIRDRWVKGPAAGDEYIRENKDVLTDAALRDSFDDDMNIYNTSWYEFWKDDPVASMPALKGYKFMVKDLIRSGADVESARITAMSHITKNYGVTESDTGTPGGKVMANPPDRLGDWAVPQFQREKTRAWQGAVDKYGEDNIFLESDGLTNQQGQPTYRVMVRTNPNDRTLVNQLVDDNGDLVRWEPIYELTKEYQTGEKLETTRDAEDIYHKQWLQRAEGVLVRTLNEGLENSDEYGYRDANFQMGALVQQALKDLEKQPDMYTVVGRGRSKRTIFNKKRYDMYKKDLEKIARQIRVSGFQQAGKADQTTFIERYKYWKENKPKGTGGRSRSARKY